MCKKRNILKLKKMYNINHAMTFIIDAFRHNTKIVRETVPCMIYQYLIYLCTKLYWYEVQEKCDKKLNVKKLSKQMYNDICDSLEMDNDCFLYNIKADYPYDL